MRKRSKNRSGLEKEDGWLLKYQPVIVVLQSVNTLNKKANTNQLHCWRGDQWNIILKRYFRYHITIVYSKGFERRNPKLSQTTQEVASVRGSSLFIEFFIIYYLHFDCTNELKTAVVWKRKTVGAQASKAHVPRKSARLFHESVTRCMTRCYVRDEPLRI